MAPSSRDLPLCPESSLVHELFALLAGMPVLQNRKPDSELLASGGLANHFGAWRIRLDKN